MKGNYSISRKGVILNAMDIVWIVIGGLLVCGGIIGCLLPFLPGPPLSYAGLLLLQLQDASPFSTQFLLAWAIVVIAVTIVDYLIPLYGTKRFGGSRFGMWGCAIGLVIGFWFGPIGIMTGPFLGSLVGEWIGHQNTSRALKAAVGSFVGFLFGTVIKLVASVMMLYYFIGSLLQ